MTDKGGIGRARRRRRSKYNNLHDQDRDPLKVIVGTFGGIAAAAALFVHSSLPRWRDTFNENEKNKETPEKVEKHIK